GKVALPGAVEQLVVGGGGRYIILHLPSKRQLAVFDANEARVVKYLPLAEDAVKIAAGKDKLFVVLLKNNLIVRYNLRTFEKEVTAQFPVPGAEIFVALMGSHSHGPLV